MAYRLLSLCIFIIVSASLAAQDKTGILTMGIERGLEKSNSKAFLITENGVENFLPKTPHTYWRVYLGIPFQVSNLKMEAGLGISRNQFKQHVGKFFEAPGTILTEQYSVSGFDLFFKIPIGIGEDRFDMGPEFRQQIMITDRQDSNQSIFPTSLSGAPGKVKSSYFNMGVFANYILFRKPRFEMGLNTSFGYSISKYRFEFLTTDNLSLYMYLGLNITLYRSEKK